MKQELKRCSSIGDKNGILFLCKELLTGSKVDLSSVKSLCSFVNGMDLNFSCGVLALQELQLLDIKDNICISKSLVYDILYEKSFIKELCICCFKFLSKNKLFDDNQVRYDESEDHYYIPRSGFKLDAAIFRNLLISLDALKAGKTKFFINNNYEQIFKTVIKERKTMTLDQLLNKLEHQKIIGEAGEHFVLNYEKSRCPFSESQKRNIKQISEIDVSAGYDIISYHSDLSDQRRYIEVKTFIGKPHFHWSINEINSAKLRKSDYYIYLVDYNQLNEKGYIPTIIKNPYQEIFHNNKWNYSIDSYLVDAK